MKKWNLPVVLALVMLLTMTVFATEESVTIMDTKGRQGEVIYLTVSLSEAVEADVIGIAFSYDAQYLQLVNERCAWLNDGILEDFGMRKNSGAWAAKEPQMLQGEICVLAFRIRENVYFEETTVSCQLTMKRGEETVADWSVNGLVTMVCDHAYDQWRNDGDIGHSHVCTLCGIRQTNSHNWDNGVISDHPTDSMLKLQTFTCTECGGQKVKELQKDQGSSFPLMTDPAESAPTRPSPPVDTHPGEHDHNYVTLPQQGNDQDDTHSHTHADGSTDELTDDDFPQVIIILLVLIAAMLGFAQWFVRKKK